MVGIAIFSSFEMKQLKCTTGHFILQEKAHGEKLHEINSLECRAKSQALNH